MIICLPWLSAESGGQLQAALLYNRRAASRTHRLVTNRCIFLCPIFHSLFLSLSLTPSSFSLTHTHTEYVLVCVSFFNIFRHRFLIFFSPPASIPSTFQLLFYRCLKFLYPYVLIFVYPYILVFVSPYMLIFFCPYILRFSYPYTLNIRLRHIDPGIRRLSLSSVLGLYST